MEAASFLSPIKNEPLKKSLEQNAKAKFKGKLPGLGMKTVRRLGDDQLDEIINKIDPEDSVLSIEHYLRDHRIDLPSFKSRLTDVEGNYSRLTDKQKRELNKPVKNSFLGDLLFRAFK